MEPLTVLCIDISFFFGKKAESFDKVNSILLLTAMELKLLSGHTLALKSINYFPVPNNLLKAISHLIKPL